MKKNKVADVFVFLLVIPYLCTLTLIGIGFNALVIHPASLWRTAVGALVGAVIMFGIKGTIQRPLDLISDNVENSFFLQILRFFSVRRRRLYQLANILLDFILCGLATYLVRQVLTFDQIAGTAVGWVMLIMFISTAIGAYLEYDNLSIDPTQK